MLLSFAHPREIDQHVAALRAARRPCEVGVVPVGREVAAVMLRRIFCRQDAVDCAADLLNWQPSADHRLIVVLADAPAAVAPGVDRLLVLGLDVHVISAPGGRRFVEWVRAEDGTDAEVAPPLYGLHWRAGGRR